MEKSAGLNKFGLSAGPRFNSGRTPVNCQLKSIWIWASRPLSRGSKLLFLVIKANWIRLSTYSHYYSVHYYSVNNVSISIVNVHQATAKRHDLQLLLRAMIDAALTQQRIMGGDFNAALSRYGYAQSTSAPYDKVDKFFQDFVHWTHGTLIESEVHTRRDLLRGSSASLDHIITWKFWRARTHAQCKAQQAKCIGWVQNAMTMH